MPRARLALALLLATAPLAPAQTTYTWTGAPFPTFPYWDTAANWSGGVPQAGGVVLFNAASSINTVFLPGSSNPIDTLRFDSGSVSYSLTGGPGSTLNFQVSNLVEVTAGTTADQTIQGRLNRSGAGALRNNGTGTLTVTNVVTPGVLGVDGSGATAVVGAITGVGSLAKSGASTLTLSGTNGYTGGTTVSGGILSINTLADLGTASSVGTGGVTLNGGTPQYTGGTVTVNRGLALTGAGTVDVSTAATALTLGGVISGSGGLTKQGAGTLTLSGTNTYFGGTTVSGGTLQLGSGGTTGSVAGNVTNNAALAFHRSDDFSFGGLISGSGSVAKLGANTLALTADNTYAGGTTVSAGTLQFGNGGTTGGIAGNVVNNGTLAFHRSDDLSFGGVISGTGGVTKLGGNTLTLTATNNSYTGPTVVSGGLLSVARLTDGGINSSIGASSNAAPNLVLDGGTLRVTGSNPSTNRLFTLGPGGGTLQANQSSGTFAFSGIPADSIAFTGTGARTLTLAGTGNGSFFRRTLGDSGSGATSLTKDGTGTWTWTIGGGTAGDVNYTGATTVNAGALVFSLGSFGGSYTLNSALTVGANARFDLNSNNLQVGSLAGGGTVRFGSGSDVFQFLSVGRDNTSTTFSGTLALLPGATGTPFIVKQGTGTLTLAGSRDYVGRTQIESGTLAVDVLADGGQPSSIGASSNDAANLIIRGSATNTLKYTGPATSTDRLFTLVSGGGTIDSSGTGTLHFTNPGQIPVESSRVVLTLTGTADGILAPALTGTPTALAKTGPGTWTLTGANTYGGATTVSAGTLRVNGSLGNTAVAVQSGGTLGGSGTVGGVVTVAGGAGIAPGNSVGTLTVGGLTVTNGSLLAAEVGSAAANDSDKLVVTGSANPTMPTDVVTVAITGHVTGYAPGVPVSYLLLDVGGSTTLTAANFALDTTGFTSDVGGSWSHVFSSGDLIATFTPVPEPGAMLGVAAVGLGPAGWVGRRVRPTPPGQAR